MNATINEHETLINITCLKRAGIGKFGPYISPCIFLCIVIYTEKKKNQICVYSYVYSYVHRRV